MVGLITFVNLGGGLCLFLFGMHLLSRGLEKFAGAKLQNWIEKMTNRPVKGFFVGIATTGILQSSSLTMITIIGLINAGLMTSVQSVGVILGTEIGTTVTAQIIAFDIGDLFMIPVIFGFIIYFLSKKFKQKSFGQAVLGFGILFMGMSIMSSSMAPLAQDSIFADMLSLMSTDMFLAIIFGAVFTAVIQSSSAMVGTVIAMSMNNLITLPAAIGVLLGANIGTCITSFIASIESSISAKRAAASQIIINILGVLFLLPFVQPYSLLIQLTSTELPRQIANAHTVFNLGVSLILLPFAGLIVRLSEKIVSGKEYEMESVRSLRKEKLQKSPEKALKYAELELKNVLNLTMKMLRKSRRALLSSDLGSAKTVLKLEPKVDKLRYVIEDFLDEVSWVDATEEQLKERMRIAHNTTDMERVGDLAENIANNSLDVIKKKIPFSKEAKNDLREMFSKVTECYASAVKSVVGFNKVLANKAVMIEEEVDTLYWKYRDKHVERLEKGLCDHRAEEIFTNVMRDLERISDHGDNLAKSILHQEGFFEI